MVVITMVVMIIIVMAMVIIAMLMVGGLRERVVCPDPIGAGVCWREGDLVKPIRPEIRMHVLVILQCLIDDQDAQLVIVRGDQIIRVYGTALCI